MDCFLARRPQAPTHLLVVLLSVLLAAAAIPVLWVVNDIVYLLFPLLCLLGFAQSATETLVYKHVSEYATCSSNSADINAVMNMFSTFYMLGFGLGGVAGGLIPAEETHMQRVVITACAVGVMVYGVLLGLWSNKQQNQSNDGTVAQQTPALTTIQTV
eukprot:jgi/Chrzof1/6597/Cz19g02040.t1